MLTTQELWQYVAEKTNLSPHTIRMYHFYDWKRKNKPRPVIDGHKFLYTEEQAEDLVKFIKAKKK